MEREEEKDGERRMKRERDTGERAVWRERETERKR